MKISNLGKNFDFLNENLASANFAMVMSTGIVSIALHLLGCSWGAWLLFAINIIMFLFLWPMYIIKLIRYPRRMFSDFAHHLSGPGFLTIVAGTNILGSQFAALAGNFTLAKWLFWLGTGCWIFMIWGIFYYVFTKNPKPPLANGINGAWLVATVSTQSIVILGATIAKKVGWDLEWSFYILCALFLLGLMLYIFVITTIFFRFCFAETLPKEMDPTYWINAGAVAITTLAGATLILHNGECAILDHFMPYIKGTTLLAWATASWWIPMLFLLGFWRHILKGYTFAYTAAFWGMVFPMGMYTACTATFSEALAFPTLMKVSDWFVWVAIVAWTATFIGMIWSRGKILLEGAPKA
ncbi:MAG: tellurite resistance/C4-dicarboxylate transporter family protein [Desulfovibrio sp.]|nr:tellurite resistance/C4-dicarboxylate transporter family protein [Desulfovibrio sp.]